MFAPKSLLGLKTTILILFALCMMVCDQRGLIPEKIKHVLSTGVAPIQFVVNWPVALADRWQTIFTKRTELAQENQTLRTEQLILQAQVQKLLAIDQENQELKALLNVANRDKFHFVIAELLALDASAFVEEAVLDKGQSAAIFSGLAVLDANGVMGQILDVAPLTSRVMLITDTRSAIPVQDRRSGVRAIVAGDGPGMPLKLEHVTETADVKVGDELITSGLGEHFPLGFPVGTITAISPNSDELFPTIKVKPAAALDHSRMVLLILPEHTVPEEALKKEAKAIAMDKKIENIHQGQVIIP